MASSAVVAKRERDAYRPGERLWIKTKNRFYGSPPTARGHAQGQPPLVRECRAPETAEPLYERFAAALRALGVSVETGVFGARMLVEIANDGPVTVILEAGETA